jgi:hypothetical protein
MIRVVCPSCQSKLDCKDEIAGQTRKCPRCRQPVRIPLPEEAAQTDVSPALVTPPEEVAEPEGESDGPHAEPQQEAPVRHLPAPERLVRPNRYLICDRTKVFAVWEADGQGWMISADFGYVGVARNADKLPSQGNFQLVELSMSVAHQKPLLQAMVVYQLAQRWALTNLVRGDDAILKSITGPGSLKREQKVAVRKYLGDRMMREIWGDNQAVLEYLGNYDFHSPGAGVKAERPQGE